MFYTSYLYRTVYKILIYTAVSVLVNYNKYCYKELSGLSDGLKEEEGSIRSHPHRPAR